VDGFREFISFPLGTLGINFIGSFLLSIAMYISEYKGFFNEETKIFLTFGLLGALQQCLHLVLNHLNCWSKIKSFCWGLNIIGAVTLTLFGVYLGKLFVVNLWSR